MATTETVYKGKDNSNVVSFYEDNTAMDFSAVTRTVLNLYNKAGELVHTEDSNSSPVLISWATNQITFTLGAIAVGVGDYQAGVTVYDSLHPAGQQIAHPLSNDDLLLFRFVRS